ncbi:MAG: hypothetical protein D3909_11015 [Candidatus Electrothrix sp. ATG1]|nr:hypothetical protein [Candidatus Electrothrix sp. ATG1]
MGRILTNGKKNTCFESNSYEIGLLLKKLGSYKRIMEATVDELRAVPGIGRKTAESVCRQLHEG